MNYIDIIFIIPIIWFAYKGFKRGLIIELASLVALILGIYAALYFSGYAADFLVNNFDMGPKYVPVVAFIITFIGVVIVVHFIGRIMEKLINMVALGFLNKLTGGIFGIMKAILFISIVLMIIHHFNDQFISKDKQEGSLLYEPIAGVAPFLWDQLEHFNPDGKGVDTVKKNIDDIEI
ncbi:MAG: CvpA family protein [Bacteroidetes bacterium]|nr:CvpA family protein [Bacteroidota bacterium]